MKALSIIIICLFFVACGAKKSKRNSTASVVSPPSVSIDTEPLVGITTSNAINFVIKGSCSEEGQPVIVSVGDVNPETAPTCSNESWEVTMDVSRLLTGASRPITITADHSTSGGLAAAPASETVTLAPRVGIATSLGNITGDTFTVTGTCSEDGQAIIVEVGGISPTTAPTCSATGTWSVNVDVSGLLTGPSREITITAGHSTSSGLAATPASETVTLAPRVGIATGLGNITGDTFTVTGTCSEDGQPVTVSVGTITASPAPTCTSTGTWSVDIDVSGLGASGEINIIANHSTSGASPLNATPASETVTLYPRVGIASGLGNITEANATSFSVNGTCSENNQPVTVSVGTVVASPAPTCTSTGTWSASVDVSGLTGASREITVTAGHSTSGGLAATPASETVTLAPRVGIATGLGNITEANATSFSVNGTCSENNQPVTVSVGTVAALPAPTCTSTGTWSASVDVSGLTGASREITITAGHSTSSGLAATPASETVTLAPRVGIASGLGNITEANATSFSVNGTCSENNQPVTVSVGTVTAFPTPTCTSTGTWSASVDVSGLLTGASREITITAGHSTSSGLAATPASETVTLAPRVGIASGLGNITEANATSFSVNGTCSENNQPVTVSVGTVTAFPTPTCTSTGTWSASVDVSGLLTGASREITVTAGHSTSSGLAAAPASETVTLAPRVGIASGLGNITGDTFTVTGTCSENNQPVTVSVGTVAALPAPTCTSGAWSVDIDVSGLTGASRPITITANHSTSGSSPLAATPASETVTLAPRVGIATGLGNITEANATSFSVNGTCSENNQPVTVSVGTVVASPAPTCTSTGTWSVNVDVSGLLTGASQEITITAGHSTSSGLAATPASETVTLAPRVGIATGLGNITEANAASFSVNGTCSENNQPVTVSVGTVAASPAPTCTSGAWSVDIDVSGLLTGPSREITITAGHSTSSGLAATPASETVTLAPRVGIASGLGNITEANAASFSVNGTCSENNQPVTVSVGTVAALPAPTCTSGTWSVDIDVSGLLTGPSQEITVTAGHSTSDGLAAAPASETVTLAPRVGIATGLGNITEANAASFSVNGTCSENNQPVTVSVGTVTALPAPTCTSGAWSVDIDVSGLLTGPSREITITAGHSTSGGLAATPASETVTLAPRVGIAATVGNITGATFAVNGICSENNQPVTVDVGGESPTTAPLCTGGTWSTSVDVSGLTGASRPIAMTADHATSGASPLNAIQAMKTVTLYPRVGIDTESLVDITSFNSSSFSVSGTCSEDSQAVIVEVGGISPATAPTCTSGAWSVDIDVSALSGTSVVTAITANHSTSGDPALSATPATASVLLNPPVSIDTPALENITAINAASFVVSGACSDNDEPVIVSVGGVSPETVPNCTTGTWTTDIDVTGLSQMPGTILVTADHSPSGGSAYPQATANVTNHFTCPLNYVGVPALASYTTHSFCVMKYEAKNDGSNNAISQASGAPYVRLDHSSSIAKCTDLGDDHDMITNDEWQSLARNIELVPGNWATGAVGNAGGLSRGHSDNSPFNALAASSDDHAGCHQTEETCDGSTWHAQRRTHTLSNGQVIWDVSGNVWEWVKDTNNFNYGAEAHMSQVTPTSHPLLGSLAGGTTTTPRNAKDQFGPSGDYTNLSSVPYGGLGNGWLNDTSSGVVRGGYWGSGENPGVFTVSLLTETWQFVRTFGFRCVYHPSSE